MTETLDWVPGKFNAQTGPQTQIWHLDGVEWADAPIPPRRHKCIAQTRGVYNFFTEVERCACGAIRYGDWGKDEWLRRNERLGEEVPEPKRRWWRRG